MRNTTEATAISHFTASCGSAQYTSDDGTFSLDVQSGCQLTLQGGDLGVPRIRIGVSAGTMDLYALSTAEATSVAFIQAMAMAHSGNIRNIRFPGDHITVYVATPHSTDQTLANVEEAVATFNDILSGLAVLESRRVDVAPSPAPSGSIVCEFFEGTGDDSGFYQSDQTSSIIDSGHSSMSNRASVLDAMHCLGHTMAFAHSPGNFMEQGNPKPPISVDARRAIRWKFSRRPGATLDSTRDVD